MATGSAVLSVQDLSDGDDVIGVDSDDRCVHSGALHGHLSSDEGPDDVEPWKSRQGHRRHLDQRLHLVHSVSHSHAHLLLPEESGDERIPERISRLQHSDRMDAADEGRIPDVHLRVFRRSDVHHGWTIRSDRSGSEEVSPGIQLVQSVQVVDSALLQKNSRQAPR